MDSENPPRITTMGASFSAVAGTETSIPELTVSVILGFHQIGMYILDWELLCEKPLICVEC
jgi:hypothetical protein